MTVSQASSTPRRRLPVRRWVPYAIFALACVVSAAVSWYVSATTEARARATLLAHHAEFLGDAERTRQQLQVRLDTYLEVIRAGAALLAASSEISPFEFRAFVAGLNLPERYPGMAAIGFAQRVAAADLAAFRRLAELDGITRLRPWRASRRAEYYPVIFLEPRDRGGDVRATLDLSSDPVLQDAMERARDTAQPVASGRVGEDTFLILVPVYRLGAPLDTVDHLREALYGFVFSPFSAESLLDRIAAGTTASVTFEVHDRPAVSRASLFSDPITVLADGRYESAGPVQVADREWLVVVRSTGATVSTGSSWARVTLVAGFLLSLMLFSVTFAQVRAWETVVRHEAELRASEQALRESEAQARAAGHAKDEFLATLSHELRTPLNAILGWVSMLRLGSVREERQPHALAVIERNARLQADLIEDLLDVSRNVMGQVRLQLRPTLVTPIVTGVVESLRPGAEATGIHLHARASAGAVTIRADAERLQQIVWNVVSNAIKFTPAGGHVYVELTSGATRARLTVRDTGIGIAPEFLPHVFERFRQADSSSTRQHRGLGLGLSIVQQLVELHGWTVEARSEGLNRGAEFIVHFPLVAAITEASLPLIERDPLPERVLNDLRVLVVDDDQSTRELLIEALSVTGARVTSAASASEALQALTAAGADVLVSDIAMPEEDGLSLMRRIRALPGDVARIPAIALTAFAGADDRQRAIEAGYQRHLAKPVELSELHAELARLTRPPSAQAPRAS